jgi:tRNA(adenine34) deaminase
LDESWKEAFRQAWEALRCGNIGVGAAVSSAEGVIVHAARNRVADSAGPPGEVYGSSLAHAEMNVLARLTFRQPRELVLTTTLQPCLQCCAAIRFGPVAMVRVAGADVLWEGCDDFRSMSAWAGRRPPVPVVGPRRDELGVFGTLISRFGLGLIPAVEEALREQGEGPIIELAMRLERSGELRSLMSQPVEVAFATLWPELQALATDAWHRKPTGSSRNPSEADSH